MRLDAITVVLRPRSAWEAVELGTALVRRHAAAIWRPWCAVTLPLFVLANLGAWWLGAPAAAALLMWWLKPVFDRIPLFVLSRAVFGDVPGTRATLRGAFAAPGRSIAHLTWRRLSPARPLLMPIDILEGGSGAAVAARRRVLGGPAYGVATLCTATFSAFESALLLGLASLVFLFVPDEYLKDSFTFAWRELREAPAWLQVVQNACVWAATSVVEPFFVGSGFGLYLNRRTEIEGWDIELAFRRLRTRLLEASTAILVLGTLAFAAPPARAAEPPADTHAAAAAPDLRPLFADDYRDPAPFDRAAARAFADPRLHPRREVKTWEPRRKRDEPEGGASPVFEAIARVFAAIAEFGAWALAALLVLLLALTAKRWWPWVRGLAEPARPAPANPVHAPAPVDPALPADVVATARRLWTAGRAREALALVYRASVESMLAATGAVLPPGATEAHCLRAAQALPEDARRAFTAVVRQWQQAAWADRLPQAAAFEATLDAAAARFGWRA